MDSENKDLINFDLLNSIRDRFDLKEQDIRTYSPLTLAYIGDSVYELLVRSSLVLQGNRSVDSLTKKKISLVNAVVQSKNAEILQEYFTEEEADIYRSGKNAKTSNHSKSAAYKDYHKATGLEAVFGYLYLTGRIDRCIELLKITMDIE